MRASQTTRKLAKLLAYILGHRPHEFGLVPDPDGFVKLKDLLKVLNAEDGLTYVRRRHLDEIVITLPTPPVEIQGSRIRAVRRENLPHRLTAHDLPRLLYTCVRRKAYPAILHKGLLIFANHPLTLSTDRELAEKIGRRMDSQPVLLTVHVRKALDLGIRFEQAGGTLFVAEALPASCLTGPPLPKQKPEAPPSRVPEPVAEKTPGSYLADLSRPRTIQPAGPGKGKKDISWKKDRRRKRRQGRQKWPDEDL